MASKKDVFASVQKTLNKKFGDKSRTLSGDTIRTEQGAIPTGIDVLDHYILGKAGGFPCGSRGVTEMFSEEGGGKSSLMYTLIGGAQRADVVTQLCDSEYSLSPDRADAFGFDPERIGMLEPAHMEEAFGMFEATLDALPDGEGALIGWDSLAATPTKAEVDDGLTEPKSVFDTRAKIISRSLRILGPKIAAKGVAFVVINQPRTKIGVMFGDPTTTPGGQALKSAASVRLQLFPGKFVEEGGEKVGRFITVSTKKTRFSPPRKAKLLLRFETGFDNAWSTLDLAKTLGVIGPRERGSKALEKAHAGLAARLKEEAFPAEPTGTTDGGDETDDE